MAVGVLFFFFPLLHFFLPTRTLETSHSDNMSSHSGGFHAFGSRSRPERQRRGETREIEDSDWIEASSCIDSVTTCPTTVYSHGMAWPCNIVDMV